MTFLIVGMIWYLAALWVLKSSEWVWNSPEVPTINAVFSVIVLEISAPAIILSFISLVIIDKLCHISVEMITEEDVIKKILEKQLEEAEDEDDTEEH
jgi:hypothetical protein